MGKIDCSSCGKSVDEDMLFCPYCFNEFSKQDEAPPPQQKQDREKPKPPDDDDSEAEPRRKRKRDEFEGGQQKKSVDAFDENFFENEEAQGDLIDRRYNIIEPYHFTCSRAVYKVEDITETGTYYSLREFLIQGEDFIKKDEIVEEFEASAENFVSLSHRGMSRIVDYFNESNYLYLVYEYAEGKNLVEFLHDFHTRTQQGVPEGLIVSWALVLCDLLIYLHKQSPEPVYCIDMKPSFLIMNAKANHLTFINVGTVYILDAINALQSDGSVYIEDLKEQYKSPQRDIWCIGAIMLFFLTGVDIQKYTTLQLPPIEQQRPDLSKSFLEILHKALGRDQLSYYESARELKIDLTEKCKARSVSTYDFYYEYSGVDISKCQWSTYLGNNQRTGSLGRGPRLPMKNAWRASSKKGSIIHLIPYEDKVLASFSDGEFFLLNAQKGSVEWHYSLKDSTNGPVIFDNSVIVSTSSSQSLFSIKIGKASPQWEVSIDGMILSSPVVKEEMIYLITYDGLIVAVEREEGEIFWREPLEVRVMSSPALSGDTLFVSALNGIVYSINLEDRDFNWQFNTEGAISSSPSISKDCVYAANHEGYIFCLEKENGDLRWEYEVKGSVTQSVRVLEDMVFCVTQKGILFCFSPETGDTLWKVNLGASADYPFSVTNNKIYMLMPDSRIFCFDAFTGKLLDKIKLDEKLISNLLVFKGALFLATQSGTILCYR